MNSKKIVTQRTARYYYMGGENKPVDSIWFVLHGYGQLAEKFLESLSLLSEGNNLVVAPEALNRFYFNSREGRIVGASWMTKEDRENDITDYVKYLDAVYEEVISEYSGKQVKLFLLGFSQGAATAWRWSMLGKIHPDRLILWGGAAAADPEWKEYIEKLNNMNPLFVVGSDDKYISGEAFKKEIEKMDAAGLKYSVMHYEGKHELDSSVLEKLINEINNNE